jgi:hypothetical protein
MGIAPQYVLDEMSFEEMAQLFKATDERDRAEWEKIRYSAYYTLIAMGCKIKITDIVLPIDEKKKPKKVYTKEERKQRLNKGKKLINGKR